MRGGSVEDMAEKVGVSQPYVYRLFGTKKDLFLAAAGHVRGRVLDTFGEEARSGSEDDALEAMGQSYNLEFFRREEMKLLLQGFAASEDPDIKEAMVSGFAEIWGFVQEATNSSDEETWNFMAAGMMLTVDAAIDLMPRLGKEEWLQRYMRDEL